jgi:hypothetical protein
MPLADLVKEDGGTAVTGREHPLEVHVVHVPITELNLHGRVGQSYKGQWKWCYKNVELASLMREQAYRT